jgi:hypothetical protein
MIKRKHNRYRLTPPAMDLYRKLKNLAYDTDPWWDVVLKLRAALKLLAACFPHHASWWELIDQLEREDERQLGDAVAHLEESRYWLTYIAHYERRTGKPWASAS